jgi:glycosyltransferase involved in cell wall biosynthesis
MKHVDIIIPVYNTPLQYLSVALDSIRSQTYKDWTAWIVNDASNESYTQQMVDLLASYQDHRFQYLYSDHRGPSGSRNVGIHAGKAPYVAFLDSDDYWMPTLLEHHVTILDKQSTITLVHAHFELIDSEGKRLQDKAPHKALNGRNATQLLTLMLRENYVSTSSVMVRRYILEQVGGFDETFPCLVDKELWMRMLNAGAQFYYESEVLFQYRLHPQNISKKTDLLLATRMRIIQKAESIIQGNTSFSDIDWSKLKRDMASHMHREAAEAYLDQGMYLRALKHSSPIKAGMSRNSLQLFLRCMYHAIRR